MGTGASLLLTLLTTDNTYECPIVASTIVGGLPTEIAAQLQNNIKIAVDNIKPLPKGKPNLHKNVAQKKLYEVLYEIIEKEYEEPPPPEILVDPKKAKEAQDLSRDLNSAIGMALESALSGRPIEGDDRKKIETLRRVLREKVIESLTPK